MSNGEQSSNRLLEEQLNSQLQQIEIRRLYDTILATRIANRQLYSSNIPVHPSSPSNLLDDLQRHVNFRTRDNHLSLHHHISNLSNVNRLMQSLDQNSQSTSIRSPSQYQWINNSTNTTNNILNEQPDLRRALTLIGQIQHHTSNNESFRSDRSISSTGLSWPDILSSSINSIVSLNQDSAESSILPFASSPEIQINEQTYTSNEESRELEQRLIEALETRQSGENMDHSHGSLPEHQSDEEDNEQMQTMSSPVKRSGERKRKKL